MTAIIIAAHEAAKRLGLARQTLARWRVEGKGPPYVKVGSRVFYRVEVVDDYLRALPLRRSTADVVEAAT